MATPLEAIFGKVESLRRAAADRDQRHRDVHDVRSGDIDTVIPGSMPDAWPKPIVANLVDTSARDMAETMGVMPSVNCATSSMTTQKARNFATKKTKIASWYLIESGLYSGQQIAASDHYLTYGMAIYVVEPDFKEKRPHIRVENPMGVYPELDAFGRLRSYTKVWREEAIHLVAKYPQLLRVIQGNQTDTSMWAERQIELVKYMDNERIVMYLPQFGNMVVDQMENVLGKIYVAVGKRPGYDHEIRGAFDDAIWVQLAKSRMALLGLEATEKTVRAPLAVPRDVQKMTFGDDAIIRTDNPDKIKRVGIDVPQAAMQEAQLLEQELRVGTRTPEARSGNMDASIITGRGVQALMGGFNTVITTGQQVIGEALRIAINLAFEMDEALWPNEKRTIRGTVQGSPFEESYTPSKDIDGDYTVDVTYGFAAGQDPARAIVGLLQLRGDQLISRDFFQRQLPMNIDVVAMQTQIDNEQFTDALKQGVMGYMQAIPQMALQSQAQGAPFDPVPELQKVAKLIELREKGKTVADAVLEVFKPKEQPQGQGQPQNPLEAALSGGQGPGGPGGPSGAGGASQVNMAGVTPQAGEQQGRDLMSLLAGLNNKGQPSMAAQTRRQQPV
jgi:hypothetical protein